MGKEDSKFQTVVAVRDFVTAKESYKAGDVIKISRQDARAFKRRHAAADEGSPEADAAIAASKAPAKKAAK